MKEVSGVEDAYTPIQGVPMHVNKKYIIFMSLYGGRYGRTQSKYNGCRVLHCYLSYRKMPIVPSVASEAGCTAGSGYSTCLNW